MATVSTTPWLSSRTAAALEVHLLGIVDFDAALFLQERLIYEISGRNDSQGALLLCEHPPVVTFGREGSRSHLLVDAHDLTARQMETRWVNRGGGCLVHAPGQLAVYPIVPLDRLGMGISDYRRRLEQSVLDVCGEMRVSATRRDEAPGLWCRTGQFAHLGVAVRSWVAYHGLFVNVSIPAEFLQMVEPGKPGERWTSLATLRARATAMHTIREGIVRNLAGRLGYERSHVYTGHPLLRRTKKRVYVGA